MAGQAGRVRLTLCVCICESVVAMWLWRWNEGTTSSTSVCYTECKVPIRTAVLDPVDISYILRSKAGERTPATAL